MPTTGDSKNHKAILEEAGRCLLEEGFTKTTMKNVADRLGMSRQTVYRTFENRDDLLAALYIEQFYQRVFDKVHAKMKNADFESSFIEGTKLTIELVRKSPVMIELMHRGGAQWFQNNMSDYGSSLHRRVMRAGEELWRGQIESARLAGKLNPALTNDEIYDWLSTIHYMMIFRRKATMEDHVALLEKLVIPALLNHSRN